MRSAVSEMIADKDQLRRRIWTALEGARVTRFPGAWGRIPIFAGAEEAAERVRSLGAWKSARYVKCNPDSPQLPLRRAALEEGKTVYMAVPRLRRAEAFVELDPARLTVSPRQAASINGALKHGRPVHPLDMPKVDLVVCGAVAVARDGSRLGKGGGYADLEFAVLRELRVVDGSTPVLTTVHPLQLVAEPLPMRVHDLPVDYAVTPNEIVETEGVHARPDGVRWQLLDRERIEKMPLLHELWVAATSGERRLPSAL